MPVRDPEPDPVVAAVLRDVADQACELVRAGACAVHLREHGSGLLRTRDEDSAAVTAEDGMASELLRTRRPVRVRSAMAVPLLDGHDVLGLLMVSEPERVFSAEDAEAAARFGRLAGIAVREAQAAARLRHETAAVRRQVGALRRAASVDEQLSDLVLAGAGVAELVQALSEILGKPCALHDAGHRCLAAASPAAAGEGMLPRLLQAPCVDAPAVRAALRDEPSDRAYVVGPLPATGLLHRYVVAPIAVGDELWGRLVVMEHQSRFAVGDPLTVRRAATLLGLQLRSERDAAEADWDAGASLVGELLAGGSQRVAVERRAARLGVCLDTPHLVVVLGARAAPCAGATSAADFRAVDAAFALLAPALTVHATAAGSEVALLVAVDEHPGDAAFEATLRPALERVCRHLGRAGELVAGLSTVRSDPSAYATAHAEARQVLECIRRYGLEAGPAVVSAADLGTGRVFLASSDPQLVASFAGTAFDILVRDPSKVDLLTTLRTFFETMASIRRCAARLGVHENTIRYRLARIEELTGLPVTQDPDAQLGARLALLVLTLQGRLPVAADPPPASCGSSNAGRASDARPGPAAVSMRP